MPRQLRMGGGIMEVAPRERAFLGGIKKAFKGITKGIGSFLKSDIGKLALTAGSLYGLGGLGGGSKLTGLLGKAKGFYDGLSGVQKIGGALALGGAFGGMEDQQLEELKANPEALANYLRSYYSNLNKDASPTEIEEFVQRNMKAGGGRMGYDDGTPDPTYTGNNKEDLPRGLQIDTTTSNPIPNDAPQKEVSEVAKIMLGPGRSGIGEPEDGTMKGYQFFRTQYLPKKVTEIAENYGMKESEVLTMIREEMMKYIDAPESLEKPKMAYGGRMGYENGTKPLPTLTELLKRKIPAVKMPDPFKEFLDNMTPEEKRQYEGTMSTYKKIQESMMKRLPKISEEEKEKRKIQNEIRKKQAEEMGLPPYVSLMANGGRINRAYGSDELVEQASGIEGLDININPKGVKELDLRETGGFIPPVGVKEKADDIPAMLSNNEFVFTADAVRAAGGGSVNKGAQIMYDTMKKLENGGTV
jgi:hypothetical protein